MFKRLVKIVGIERHTKTKRTYHLSKESGATAVTMATVKVRYLPNDMADYQKGNEVTVPAQRIEKQIFNYLERIKDQFEPSERNGRDGLYLGTAGVAYMFYHLSKVPALDMYKEKMLFSALDYIRPALKVCANEVNPKNTAAFLLGNSGVYAVASAIYHAVGNAKQSEDYKKMYYDTGKVCREMEFLEAGSDELFVGRAGFICGALWISRMTQSPISTDEIYELCRVIIASGKKYSEITRSTSPLMYAYYEVEYLGAGHGVCTILQMLMSVPGFLERNPLDAKTVQDSVDYVLSMQDQEGNFPPATDIVPQQSNDLVHWCHGAGGVVYLMAQAYRTYKNDKYLKSCKIAADLIWKRGLLKKGPGLCHGIAGNGYVFLLLYRLTQDQKYLHRAIQFSQYLESNTFKEKARIPDNPYSLFEGVSGTACFLADMLNPEQAMFPFTDISIAAN